MAMKAVRNLALLCVVAAGQSPSAHATFINGGFELPYLGNASSVTFLSPPTIPGWKTTATDNKIEIWANNFLGVPAAAGTQHAELNAFEVSTLYQDVTGIAAGSIVGFGFAHRGRLGLDTMAFTLTDLGSDGNLGGGNDTVLFTQLYVDGNSAWGSYSGTGIVALGNTVRFAFASISAAGGNSAIGNFLDMADFGVGVGSTVPEPTAILLVGTALAAVGWRRRNT